MNQDTKSLIRGAQQAIKLGQKQQARRLLQQVVQQEPDNFAGWLLLASVTTNPQTALAHISRAEALNPGSPTVRKARAWADARLATLPVPKVAAPNESESWWQRPYLRWGGLAVMMLFLAVSLLAAWTQARPPQEKERVEDAGRPVLASAPANNLPAAVAEVPAIFSPTAEATIESKRSTAVATPTAQVLPAKPVGHQASGPRPTWTLTPVPTPTPTPTVTPMPTFVAQQSGPVSRPFGVGPNERWIDINLTNQTLVAYEGDKPVLSTLISSGTWRTPTVTGQFRIYLTYTSQTMDGRRLGYDYYLENVPYVMYFYKDYALHGTFWHNNFGTPMSHGCVNMRTSEAEWIYNWSSIGTLVNVHY